MKSALSLVIPALALATIIPGAALAQQEPRKRPVNAQTRRCMEDVVASHLLHGRRQWLVKCGYLTQARADLLAAADIFPSVGEFVAPVDETAPCRYDGTVGAYCDNLGCYEPSQRIMFDGVYKTIGQAIEAGDASITAVGSSLVPELGSTTHEEPIGTFSVGDEINGIYDLEVVGGMKILVTDSHPMVLADGAVVRASSLEAGESRLLTTSGPRTVIRARKIPYFGQVRNVEPESTGLTDNIHLAEGFVVGSLRF